MAKTRYPGVQKLGRDRYRVRLKLTDRRTGNVRQIVRIVTAKNASEAAVLREQLREESREAIMASRKVLDCAAAWLHSKRRILKPSTFETYSYAIDYFDEALGDRDVSTLTRFDLEEFRDGLRGLPNSVNNRLRVVRTMCRDWYAFGYLERDITVGLRSVAVGPPAREKHIEADDLQRLLASLKERSPRWYPIAILLATSGMRWCEASALRWSDLNLEDGSLAIARSQVRGIIGPPKTKMSRRRLPIAPQVLDELKAVRLAQARAGKWDADGLVFPSDVGGFSYPSALYKPLDAASERTGVQKVRPHDFRHTWNRALRRAAEGAVQRSMTGHTTESMADRYDSVSIDEKRVAMGAALALLGPKSVGEGVGDD